MTKPIFRQTIFFLLIAILFISTAQCNAGPPRTISTPTQVATMTSQPISVIRPTAIPLTGEWSFSIDKDQLGEQQGWNNPAFDDSSWAKVSVPHTWNVMPEYSDYEGLGWYRRTKLCRGLNAIPFLGFVHNKLNP